MVAPPPIQLANLGMADSLILMVLALVVFGPRRLPQIGRQIGKLMYEFRKASNDFKFQMEEELRLAEDADRRKKEEAARLQSMTLAAPAAPQTVEAQADIGASPEPASFVRQPVANPGALADNYPPEPMPVAEPEVVVIPRVKPPTIGEQVSAARPGHEFRSDASTDAAESAADTETSPIASEPTTNPSATETLSQHG